MATLKLNGNSSGFVNITTNVAAANNTLTLPDVTDRLATITTPTFLNASGTAAMTIDAGGNVGIGTNLVNVGGRLIVWGDQVQASGQFTSFWNNDGTNMSVGRARGSVAAPSALLSGDRIGSLIASGYLTPNSASNTASMEFYTEENYSATAAGSQIRFLTTSPTTVGRSVKMVIQGNGNVGINSSTPTQTLDVQGNVNVLNTVIMGSSFLRNRIINGGMQIWQRGTSFSGVASGSYTADRMYIGYTGSAPTVTQVSGPTGFTYAARVTGAVGNTLTTFGQKIESFNCVDLASRTITVSAVISASVAQNFTWWIGYANATDNFSSSTNIATGTWSVTTSAATYSATITMPSQAANGIQFQVYPAAAGAFTSGTFDITGMQLEAGPVATPFERRQYGQELALCQRYFLIDSVANGQNHVFCMGTGYSAAQWEGTYTFPVEMRTAPNMGNSAVSTFGMRQAGTVTNIYGTYQNTRSILIYTSGSGLTGGFSQGLVNSGTNAAFLSFSAEL